MTSDDKQLSNLTPNTPNTTYEIKQESPNLSYQEQLDSKNIDGGIQLDSQNHDSKSAINLIKYVKKLIQEIILLILYATPLGYFLGLLKLINNKNNEGISLQVDLNKASFVIIKPNPNLIDRLRWLAYSLSLIAQALFIIYLKPNLPNKASVDFFAVFIWFLIITALTNFTCAIFPNFPWNNRQLKFSIFEIFIIICLFLTIAIVG